MNHRSPEDIYLHLVYDDLYPIGSMNGICTCIYHQNQPNEGKYTIHYMDPIGMVNAGDIPVPSIWAAEKLRIRKQGHLPIITTERLLAQNKIAQ